MDKTRSRRKYLYLTIIICLVNILILILASYFLSKEFINVIGEGTKDCASIAAKQITITDAEMEKLINMQYSDIANSDQNKRLKALVDNVEFSYDIETIYLVHKLSHNNIKYQVTEENQIFYHADKGTPLNIMWLLDVPLLNKNKNYYTSDVLRYTYSNKEYQELFNQIKSQYTCYSNEQGKVISGYAPVWSIEGNFIGYLGIDVRLSTYQRYSHASIIILCVLFVNVIIIFCFIFLYIYNNVIKVSREKIYKDSLTGVYNRRYYDEYFQTIMESNTSNSYIYILMIDVDNFKQINDTYGHEKGDECLSEISKILMKINPKVLLRYGGDEFIVGGDISTKKKLERILDKNISEINALKLFKDKKQLTISIGGCIAHRSEFNIVDLKELVCKADKNLYTSKQSGKNKYYLTFNDEI